MNNNKMEMELEMSKKLSTMLELEEHYVLRHSYFTSRVTAWHRHQLLTWLLEVCEAEGGDLVASTFGTAVNMFDRFMAREARRVELGHLQLLGCVCLFIAAKVTAGRVLSVARLADYTDNSVAVVDILEWECLVLAALQWDVASVQANDYLDMFGDKLGLDGAVVKRTRVYTALCLTEFKFAFYPASMLAAACVLVSKPVSRRPLAELLGLDIECLLGLSELVAQLVDNLTQPTPAKQTTVEFEDDYDFYLLDEFTPPSGDDTNNTKTPNKSKPKPEVVTLSSSKKSNSSKKIQPKQYCSYYILTPPQPSSLPMPTF